MEGWSLSLLGRVMVGKLPWRWAVVAEVEDGPYTAVRNAVVSVGVALGFDRLDPRMVRLVAQVAESQSEDGAAAAVVCLSMAEHG